MNDPVQNKNMRLMLESINKNICIYRHKINRQIIKQNYWKILTHEESKIFLFFYMINTKNKKITFKYEFICTKL